MSEGTAAEAMDRMYRRQRHVYDWTRRYYLLGRERLITELDARPGMRILEIGCGTGRNLILAARRYPAAMLYGVDVSNHMLEYASGAIARAKLADRVRIAQADATRLEGEALFATAGFDRVFISYALSMIPDWTSVLDCALAGLAPGGELHIVDFGGQEGLPLISRWLLRRWLVLFGVTPRDQLESALLVHAHERCGRIVVERPYRGYAQHLIMRLPEVGPSVG